MTGERIIGLLSTHSCSDRFWLATDDIVSNLRPAADPLQTAVAAFTELQDAQAGPCGTATVDTTSSEMSRLIRDLQLVDARGRKYLTADERQRFLEAARLAPRPADQTFAHILAHTGTRVSEALAVRPMDIDHEAASIRIRTLKRRAEHWREVPVPPELLRTVEFVHALRSTPAKAADKPLRPWSRATAHRKIARTMADAGVEGPQARPKGLRHGFWHRGRRRRGAASDDRGRPGPRQPADHRDLHHRRGSRGAGFSGADVGKRGEFGRIRRLKASREGL